MIVKFCRVCQYDVTDLWPAQVCSQLCRSIAAREKERRKPRSRAYRQRANQRQVQRERAKRQADPIWQARRAAADGRKKRKQQRKQLRCLAKRLARVKPKRRRLKMTDHERRERQRLRNSSLDYRLKQQERQKRRTAAEMTPIYALRELGWLDGYDVVTKPRDPPSNHQPNAHQPRAPLTKYQKVIAAYAPQYLAEGKQKRKLIRDQISTVFRKRPVWVAIDLRNKRGGNHARCKYIVDSQGNVIHCKKAWKMANASRVRLRQNELRLKRRVILASMQGLGFNFQGILGT